MGGEEMTDIIVYHGGTEIVEHPLCDYGRKNLDFGHGFYVTDIRKQASDWALQTANRRKVLPVLNRYRLQKEALLLSSARCKIFKAYDKDWLEFIVASRRGLHIADQYDYIEGGVANDRVIDTIEVFMAGQIEEDKALGELSKHQPNNQICILKQSIIDNHLFFSKSFKTK